MRRLFIFPFLLAILTSSASAGFNPPVTPRLSALPPAEPVEPPRCNTGWGGISEADIVARDTGLLAKKFESVPVSDNAKTCRLDDEKIAVQRYAEYGSHVVLVTTLNGANRLVYDPSKAQNALVMPDLDTWSVDNCPGGTVEWLQQEMLRRLYACYPEAGYHVTSLAADKEAEKARAAAEIEFAKGPKKNPGL